MSDIAGLVLVAALVAAGASFFLDNPLLSERAMSLSIVLMLVAILLEIRWYTRWREKEYARRMKLQEQQPKR